MKKILLLMVVAAGLGSCTTETKKTLWVNSFQVECETPVNKALCLQVYKGDDLKQAQWENASIGGFTFEEGFFRKIEVTEKQVNNPDNKMPSTIYVLVREIERVKDPRAELNGEWTLVNFKGSALGESVPTLHFELGSMRVSGSNSCNRLIGNIEKLTGTELVFGKMASTLMLCPDMVLADAFDAAINEVKTYKIDNGQLLLSDAKGEVLLTFGKNK